MLDIFHSHKQYMRVSTHHLHQHLFCFGSHCASGRILGSPTRDQTWGPLQWKCRVLATGPTGKLFLLFLFLFFCFYYSYSCGCEVISNCGFNLHFPEDYSCCFQDSVCSFNSSVIMCLVDLSLYCLDLLSILDMQLWVF